MNNLIIIKFTYQIITSKHKHEFHQLNSQQSFFTNKHLWVLSRKEIIQRLWENNSLLTSNLHKAKLMLHFNSNPLNLYHLLVLQVLLSSKPFFSSYSSFSLYLSQKFCENEQMILSDLIFCNDKGLNRLLTVGLTLYVLMGSKHSLTNYKVSTHLRLKVIGS